MDAATIQAKIYGGYAKAAQRVGDAFSIYRPSGASTPIASGNLIGTVNAAMTVGQSGFNFGKAAAHKDVLFTGLYDASQTEVGDYLHLDGHGTYFVAAQQDLLPPLLVKCNRTVSVLAAGPSKTYGVNTSYGGTTEANENAILTDWPAAIIFDARGRAQEVGLPLDLPSPFYTIYLPDPLDIDLRSSNLLTDDQGRRYDIQTAEQGALGWRVFAQQAVT